MSEIFNEIKLHVANLYKLHPFSLILLKYSTSISFELNSDKGKFHLKLYQWDMNNDKRLKEMVSFTCQLAEKGFSPKIYPTICGRFYDKVIFGDNIYFLILYYWIDGFPYINIDYKGFFEVGKLLGKVHSLNFINHNPVHQQLLSENIHDFEIMTKVLYDYLESINLLTDILQKVKEIILRDILSNIDVLTVVHGDWHEWNILQQDMKLIAIDLENCKWSHPLLDFAPWIRHFQRDDKIYNYFLEGYSISNIPIEKKLLSWLRIIRLLEVSYRIVMKEKMQVRVTGRHLIFIKRYLAEIENTFQI